MEKEIGKKAANMLKSSLRNASVKRFGSHLRGGKESIKEATTAVRMRYSQRIEGGKQGYLKGIALKMVKHGFIQHYGIDQGSVRKGGTRTRLKPKETTYHFNAHLYKRGMEAKPFIDTTVENSGAVDYLAEEIPKERSEEILIYIKEQLEKK